MSKRYDEVGDKTHEMIARVLALQTLQQSGELSFKYGEKNIVYEALGCTANTFNRTLLVLEEAGKEAQKLVEIIRNARKKEA